MQIFIVLDDMPDLANMAQKFPQILYGSYDEIHLSEKASRLLTTQ
jgi:hypothetical protein